RNSSDAARAPALSRGVRSRDRPAVSTGPGRRRGVTNGRSACGRKGDTARNHLPRPLPPPSRAAGSYSGPGRSLSRVSVAMLILVSYDIPDDRRRTKLANALKDFGERVQYSVFEFLLDE